MKKIALISLFLSGVFLLPSLNAQVKNTEQNILSAKRSIIKNLERWHKAAAEANFEDYFSLMTDDAIFIGTDATENWNLEEFKEFSRPYFEAGKAWSFKAIERNIYLKENRRLAWFDELLDTHMGICRGSGVMAKDNGKWKVQHYVLSITIPNENVDEITLIKKEFDEELISKLRDN
ncbi:nuclear transport factor 2 family protein [Gramella jeungdoensis]|uniref:Nuclear transport factor 2 family protein n=1 Tax=Gramella jeungdoensis TaxID=708091 RepID=A0ABT0Z242_9FLAO|nr:nuclear transport factor 2 family protein [Gramella jeungdoensis]MCM8569440.1 nuclear transport factor 2 family protein [Gramella jeungdoensis]